jgi:hypothetical protein
MAAELAKNTPRAVGDILTFANESSPPNAESASMRRRCSAAAAAAAMARACILSSCSDGEVDADNEDEAEVKCGDGDGESDGEACAMRRERSPSTCDLTRERACFFCTEIHQHRNEAKCAKKIWQT